MKTTKSFKELAEANLGKSDASRIEEIRDLRESEIALQISTFKNNKKRLETVDLKKANNDYDKKLGSLEENFTHYVTNLNNAKKTVASVEAQIAADSVQIKFYEELLKSYSEVDTDK